MPKAFCNQCGSWENVHPDGLCSTHHYGQPTGGAFPQGAATPEELARVKGLGATNIVEVNFAPAAGPYADTRRAEANEAVARSRAEPVLGKMAEPEAEGEGAYNRVSPAGADANERRDEPNRALPEEVAASERNVAGLVEDSAQLTRGTRVEDGEARINTAETPTDTAGDRPTLDAERRDGAQARPRPTPQPEPERATRRR